MVLSWSPVQAMRNSALGYWDLAKGVGRFAAQVWRGGPVLGMELRLSSRQKRTYVIRLLYVAALAFYTALVWFAIMEQTSVSSAAGVARMADVGNQIVGRVIRFLLIAGQFAAVVLMSTLFHEELYHGRLDMLLSSPLELRPIALGKFVSRLLHLLIMLVMGLPVLAMVRVFGGVPWAMVVTGMSLVVLASFCAAVISMRYSIRYRQPYAGILRTFILLLIPSLFTQAWISRSAALFTGGPRMWGEWLILCLIWLALAFMMLRRCLNHFERAAMLALGNDPDCPPLTMRTNYFYLSQRYGVTAEPVAAMEPYRPMPWENPVEIVITGSPIVWKAMRRQWFPNLKVGLALVGLALAYLYGLAAPAGELAKASFHAALVKGMLFFGGAFVAILAATAISSDRQSGYWPLVLLTPLTDWDILKAKMLATLRRCTLLGVALGVHILAFTAAGVIHPLGALQVVMVAAWVTVFLGGLGLFCSVHFKRSVTAMMITLAVAGGLWLVAPPLIGLVERILHVELLTAMARGASPFQQVDAALRAVVLEGRQTGSSLHPWLGSGVTAGHLAVVLAAYAAVYSGLGVLMAWLAKRAFRRHAF